MSIWTEDVPEACVCCGDIYTPKTVLEIYMNYRDGSSVTVIYGCKTCGKRTRTTFIRRNIEPFFRKDGIKVRAYWTAPVAG